METPLDDLAPAEPIFTYADRGFSISELVDGAGFSRGEIQAHYFLAILS